MFIAYCKSPFAAGLDLLPHARDQALDLRALQHPVGVDSNLGERLVSYDHDPISRKMMNAEDSPASRQGNGGARERRAHSASAGHPEPTQFSAVFSPARHRLRVLRDRNRGQDGVFILYAERRIGAVVQFEGERRGILIDQATRHFYFLAHSSRPHHSDQDLFHIP